MNYHDETSEAKGLYLTLSIFISHNVWIELFLGQSLNVDAVGIDSDQILDHWLRLHGFRQRPLLGILCQKEELFVVEVAVKLSNLACTRIPSSNKLF